MSLGSQAIIGSGAATQQVITLANDDPDLHCHRPSLCRNELMQKICNSSASAVELCLLFCIKSFKFFDPGSGLVQLTIRDHSTVGMRPANERRRYIATMSLIGWVHT